MVRRLQDMEKGINERLEEEEEPMLLDGIKLGLDDEKEEKKQGDDEDEFESRKRELQDAKNQSLAAFDLHYNKNTVVAIDDISKKIYEYMICF